MSFPKGSILEKLHNYGLLDNDTAGGENGFIIVHVDAQEGSSG
jgi:hypothetical protein